MNFPAMFGDSPFTKLVNTILCAGNATHLYLKNTSEPSMIGTGKEMWKNPEPFSLLDFIIESVWLPKWNNRIEKENHYAPATGWLIGVGFRFCTLLPIK